MPRRVFLARHGETDWNSAGRWQGHTDIALNEMGRQQSRALADALRGQGLGRVHSSDLSRARQTAEIVAGRLQLGPVAVDPGLRERSFGCFEGLTRQECELRYPQAWASYRGDPRGVPPGGEAADQVAARMRAAVLRLTAALPEGDATALVVSHGGAMRVLLSSITGLVPPPLQNGAVFLLEVDGLTFGAVERVS
jgi:probable phosphoglycerate mutase